MSLPSAFTVKHACHREQTGATLLWLGDVTDQTLLWGSTYGCASRFVICAKAKALNLRMTRAGDRGN